MQLFHDILLGEEGDVDGVVLASKLTLAGYRVSVRQALGGGQGTAVFSNLRHSFLLVTVPQGCPCAGVDFIVEVGCQGCRVGRWGSAAARLRGPTPRGGASRTSAFSSSSARPPCSKEHHCHR